MGHTYVYYKLNTQNVCLIRHEPSLATNVWKKTVFDQVVKITAVQTTTAKLIDKFSIQFIRFELQTSF